MWKHSTNFHFTFFPFEPFVCLTLLPEINFQNFHFNFQEKLKWNPVASFRISKQSHFMSLIFSRPKEKKTPQWFRIHLFAHKMISFPKYNLFEINRCDFYDIHRAPKEEMLSHGNWLLCCINSMKWFINFWSFCVLVCMCVCDGGSVWQPTMCECVSEQASERPPWNVWLPNND